MSKKAKTKDKEKVTKKRRKSDEPQKPSKKLKEEKPKKSKPEAKRKSSSKKTKRTAPDTTEKGKKGAKPLTRQLSRGNSSNLGLQGIFEKYSGKGKDNEVIAEENLGKFCKDMGIDVEGVGPLLVAWKINAKNLAEYSRNEFVTGFTALSATTESKIKSKIKELVDKTWKDREEFQEFYKWLFPYCLNKSEKKALDIDVAMEVWSIVLPPHFKILKEYLDFIHKQKVKVCSRDFWDQTLEFAREINPDLSNWEDNGAWPTIIDDFVEHMKSQK